MIDLAIIIVLPKFGFLVWALVARLVSNGCSSRVHRFPITCSPRDRLESMVGTCSFLYLVDYIVLEGVQNFYAMCR